MPLNVADLKLPLTGLKGQAIHIEKVRFVPGLDSMLSICNTLDKDKRSECEKERKRE